MKPASPPDPAPRLYSTAEVSRLTGASLRQLQWWDERKFIKPKHLGGERRYSQEQVETVRRIVKAKGRSNIPLSTLRRIPDGAEIQVIKRPTMIHGVYVIPLYQQRKAPASK